MSSLKSRVMDKYLQSEGHCWYCGKKFLSYEEAVLENRLYDRNDSCKQTSFSHNKDGFRVDHIVPICCGGNSEKSNLVPACDECNRQKGKLELDMFRYILVKRELVKKYPNMGFEEFNAKHVKTIYEIWGDEIGIHYYEFYFEKENLLC